MHLVNLNMYGMHSKSSPVALFQVFNNRPTYNLQLIMLLYSSSPAVSFEIIVTNMMKSLSNICLLSKLVRFLLYLFSREAELFDLASFFFAWSFRNAATISEAKRELSWGVV